MFLFWENFVFFVIMDILFICDNLIGLFIFYVIIIWYVIIICIQIINFVLYLIFILNFIRLDFIFMIVINFGNIFVIFYVLVFINCIIPYFL